MLRTEYYFYLMTKGFREVLFISFFIVNCNHSVTFTPADSLQLIKTSRDSSYLKNQKPFSGLVKDFDGSGNISCSFNLKDGKLNGDYNKYYTNGAVLLSCGYTMGLLDGPWVSYYENEKIRESMNYDKGLLQGKRESFWNNGLIKEENNFMNGVLTGTSNFYFSSGQLRKTIAFDSNGKRNGKWLDYYPNGNIKKSINYVSGKVIDSMTNYDINGDKVPIK